MVSGFLTYILHLTKSVVPRLSTGALFLLLLLAACSRTPKDPFASKEDRTFEVGRVESTTHDVEASTTSNKKIRQINFRAKVKNMATLLPVVDGLYFHVLEGFKKITRVKVIDGTIQWSKSYEYDKGVPQSYSIYEFRIEGEGAHRGSQKKRVGVNPDRKGAEAVIDLSAGGKIPVALSDDTNDRTDHVKVHNASSAGFQAESTFLLNSSAKRLSKTTGKYRDFEYSFYTCLYSNREDVPRISYNRKFTVKNLSGFINSKIQNVVTNRQGCIRWEAHIKDFKFYEQERWFLKKIEICSDNKEASGCIQYTMYIHPWSAIDGDTGNFVFENGKPSWKSTNYKPPDEVTDGKILGDIWESRKARVLLDNYAFGFTGRYFIINEYLDISSMRSYNIVMRPHIKRWTLNGSVREEMDGKYKLYFLLNRTHAESFLDWMHSNPNLAKSLDEKCFMNKDSITEEFSDPEDRKKCLLWSNMSYGSQVVKVSEGSLVTSIAFHFPDIRYVESRNLVYFQLKSATGEDTGIEEASFVGTIYPVLDSGFRRLSDLQSSVFVQPDGESFNFPELELEIENIERHQTLEDDNTNLPTSKNREASFDEIKKAVNKFSKKKRHIISELRRYIQEGIELLNVEDSIAYIEKEKALQAKHTNNSQIQAQNKIYGTKLNPLPALTMYKNDNQLSIPTTGKNIINRGKIEEILNKYKNSETIKMSEYLDESTIQNICRTLYPLNNLSSKEAQDYAQHLRDIDQAIYNDRKKTLCEINNLVTQGKLDELKYADPCENTKRICDDNSSAYVKDSLLVDTYNVLYGANKQLKEEACVNIDEDKKNILIGIMETLSRPFAYVSDAVAEKLDSLRTITRYESIRKETIKSLVKNFGRLEGRIQIHNPSKLSIFNSKHKKQLNAYKPRTKQVRCMEEPDNYIRIGLSKHVLDIKDTPPIREYNMDSKNISISSTVFLSRGAGEADVSEKALEAGNYRESLDAIQLESSALAGLKVLGTGLAAGARGFKGYFATTSSGSHWYIRNMKEKTLVYEKNIAEYSGRTINAEEITFRFNADLKYCLNIEKRTTHDLTKASGIIYCSDEIETKVVSETWWHFYLYFRNKTSIMHDAASNLTQRPWDIVVRGKENYDRVIRLLQSNMDIGIAPIRELEVGKELPVPVLSSKEFQYRTRTKMNSPGLLEYQSVWIQDDEEKN